MLTAEELNELLAFPKMPPHCRSDQDRERFADLWRRAGEDDKLAYMGPQPKTQKSLGFIQQRPDGSYIFKANHAHYADEEHWTQALPLAGSDDDNAFLLPDNVQQQIRDCLQGKPLPDSTAWCLVKCDKLGYPAGPVLEFIEFS